MEYSDKGIICSEFMEERYKGSKNDPLRKRNWVKWRFTALVFFSILRN